MTKRHKAWVFSPTKPTSPKVSETVKANVEQQATTLIESILKPQHIKPPLEGTQFNYIVDIYTKWYRNSFYFCAKYACPNPNALSPFFESKFARMEYVGKPSQFNLAFMRHTDEWMMIYPDLSLSECLVTIQNDPLFHP
jgi:hypothetical protein